MRDARHPVLRGVKTSLFLLTVLCVSLILNMSSSRPASAESLLYGLTCTVTGLLGRDCQPRETPPVPAEEMPPPSGSGSSEGGTSGGSEPSSGQTSPSGSQVAAPARIELQEELLEELPPVTSVNLASAGHTFPAHIAPFAQTESGEVLGQATPAPIEASEEGWKIMGVSWMWWALATLMVTAGAFAAGRLVNFRKVPGVVK